MREPRVGTHGRSQEDMSTARIPRTWRLALPVALIGLAAAPSPAAEDARAGPRFGVWEYAVSGNTALGRADVERAVYPYLGPDRTVADVEQARAALEKVYRDAGYGTVVVTIPEQDVEQGLVRLEVLEGRVDRLRVTGSRYFSPAQIRESVPSLAEGTVPELPVVQKELAALNAASSDRRVTPVLRAGRSPGTVEAELKVDDSLPFHGTLEVNNAYTRDTTRTRVNATLSYDNLWQRQHSALVGYQTAPEDTDDVTVFFSTYTGRLPGSQWIASGYFVDSDTDVASLGTLGVIGKGQIAGMRFIRPLPPLAGGFQRVTLGLDYKDFDESIALTGNQPTIETPITYGALSAGWGVTFPGEGENTTLNLLAVMGPRFLGNDPEEFENKRAGSKPDFAHLNLSVGHERELWSDSRLRIAVAGQLASSPLISNEQFGFGGAGSVRGYLESEQFVDNGYSGQLELLSPDWGRRLSEDVLGRFLVFVDAGGGNLQDPLPEQDDRFFLWSTGLGLRAAFWRRLTAELDWAYPLEDNADGSIEAGDTRWHFSTRYAF
jgi:hemolysin activation/secretion protein